MEHIKFLTENNKYTITDLGVATVGDFWSQFVYFYPYYRIYLVTDGEAFLELKNSVIKLEKNNLYFIPAFQVVSCRCEAMFTHYYLHFQPESMSSNVMEYYRVDSVIKSTGMEAQLLMQMIEAYNNPSNISSQFFLDGGLKVLLSGFFRKSKLINQDIIRFAPVIDFIDKNLDSDIRVKSLAELINLDDVYFSNFFSKTFGMPPSQYIIEKRINKSRSMLAETDLHVKEIAYKLGFASEMYFSRLFKKKTNLTPSQYRAQVFISTNQ